MEMAKVTSKGQITIPVSIRRRLEINEGDKLLFIDTAEGVMMVNPDMLSEVTLKSASQKNIAPKKAQKKASADSENTADISETFTENEITAEIAEVFSDNEIAEDIAEVFTEDENAEDAAETSAESGKTTPSHGLDLQALLNEIRTIGSNSNK